MTSSNRPDDNWLSDLRWELAEAETLEQVLDVRRKAREADKAARNQRWDVIARNQAVELKLLAERKAGGMLAKLRLRGGDRKSGKSDGRLSLSARGITQKDSAIWQRVAAGPESALRQYRESANSEGKLMTTGGLIQFLQDDPESRPQLDVERDAAHSGSLSHRALDSPSDQPGRTRTTEDDETLDNVFRHCRQAAKVIDGASNEDGTGRGSKALRAAHYFVVQAMKELREILDRSN